MLLQAGKLSILIKYFLSCQGEVASLLTLLWQPAGTSRQPAGLPWACLHQSRPLSEAAANDVRALGKPFQKSSFHLPPSHLFTLSICSIPILHSVLPTLFSVISSYSSFVIPGSSYGDLKLSLFGKENRSLKHLLVDCYFLVIQSYLLPKYQEFYNLNDAYTTSKTRSVVNCNLLPVTLTTRFD